jgi:hypothetical protein
VGGGGVDLDARQKATQFKTMNVCGLFHHVLAREIVAACLQNMLGKLSIFL